MVVESVPYPTSLPALKANVAGIDVGAEVLYVAVHKGQEQYVVRHFPTFTEDLHLLTQWLQKEGVQEVAMESTGVYWIPLFQILEAQGISVCLVNARHLKSVPGRKTDVKDAVWLQRLFSFGLPIIRRRPPPKRHARMGRRLPSRKAILAWNFIGCSAPT